MNVTCVFQWRARMLIPFGVSWGGTRTYWVLVLYVFPFQLVASSK